MEEEIKTDFLLEEVKILILAGVWKKLLLTLMDDLLGFKTSMEKVN